MPPPRELFNPLEGPGDYDVTKTVHGDTYDAIDPAKLDLAGKAVFITGGSKGIGKETTLSFVRAGVSYIAVGARSIDTAKDGLEAAIKSISEQAGKKPPQFLPLKLDVSDVSSINEAAAQTKAAFGRLDILVNNAGISGSAANIADSDPDMWWKIMTVNLRGPYLLSRAFLPLLLSSADGLKVIANIASVAAHVVVPTYSSYSISKLALVRLSEYIAAEYTKDGIICFSLHPGNVQTEIFGPEGTPEEMKPIFCDTPRLGADSVVYLSSGNKQWLSGRYVNVFWDTTELEAKKDEIVSKDKLKVKFSF